MHSDKVSTTAGDGGRKSSKPIMEKKRRARINASLAELKSLLLEAIKKEGSRHSKMEKADILELTVKHLRQAQRHPSQAMPVGSDPNSLSKYRQLGFNECVQEASRYLSSIDSCNVELRTRLLNHLANCITGFDDAPMSPSTTSQSPASPMTSHSLTSPSPPPPPLNPSRVGEAISIALATSSTSVARPEPVVCLGTVARAVVSSGLASGPRIVSSELNNNTVIIQGGGAGAGSLGYPLLSSQLPPQQQQQQPPLQMGKIFSGIQVIPTKLASGEIAFVVPASVLASQTSGSYVIPVYASQTVVSTSSNPVPSEAPTSSMTMMTSVATAVPVMSISSVGPAVTHTATSASFSSSHASLPVSPTTLPVSATPLTPGVISLSTSSALGVNSPGILPVAGPLPTAPPPPPNVFGVGSSYSEASSSEASPVKSAFLPHLSLFGASPNIASAVPADSSGMQDTPKTFLASSPRVHIPLATPACSLPKVVVLQGPQQLSLADSSTDAARRRLGFVDHGPSEECGESSGSEPVWRPW